MISQNDLRLRQAKKKIFNEQPHRHKLEEKTSQCNNGKVVQSEIMRTGNIVQQLRKQVQELENINNQLKKLLKQERVRYDKLFEEYEEMTQRNSIIEKQFINLKYQHNKQIKELKKSISSVISEKISKAFEEFQMNIKQDKIAQSLKNKLEKLIEKVNELPRITEKFKMKKTNKKGSEIYEFIEERPSISHLSQRSQLVQKKLEFFQLQEALITKVSSSPQKEKSLKSIKSQSDVSNRQTFVFEDEYYGQIQDFSQFEQKIIQRRNYELMKRNSRASNQIKRKKIFDQA